MIDGRAQDEQEVLACLLWRPEGNRWELEGLDAALFATPAHREIAQALIDLRDSGRAMHWRRVRTLLRRRGQDGAARLVEPLVRAIGTSVGLTAAVSHLHRAAAGAMRRSA